MSRIQDIITAEEARFVRHEAPVMEAQKRHIALLKALDVLVDELAKRADQEVEIQKYSTNPLTAPSNAWKP